jgi:hypothetical protein
MQRVSCRPGASEAVMTAVQLLLAAAHDHIGLLSSWLPFDSCFCSSAAHSLCQTPGSGCPGPAQQHAAAARSSIACWSQTTTAAKRGATTAGDEFNRSSRSQCDGSAAATNRSQNNSCVCNHSHRTPSRLPRCLPATAAHETGEGNLLLLLLLLCFYTQPCVCTSNNNVASPCR